MATASPAAVLAAATTIVGPARPSQRRTRVNYITGLNSFDGLKAHNGVSSLGTPVSTEHCFAKLLCSMKRPAGGATCSAIDEIFRIAAIMPGLVLIGVAVGFVLLRLEASLEEE